MQDGSPDTRPLRVQVEPERIGWARLSDLIHKYDQRRVRDAKEDIDTLLVFVSSRFANLCFIHRCVRTGRIIFRCSHSFYH